MVSDNEDSDFRKCLSTLNDTTTKTARMNRSIKTKGEVLAKYGQSQPPRMTLGKSSSLTEAYNDVQLETMHPTSQKTLRQTAL